MLENKRDERKVKSSRQIQLLQYNSPVSFRIYQKATIKRR